MKDEFIKVYEELDKLNEAHTDPADYWSEPGELVKIPEYIFQQFGLNKKEYIRKAGAAYYERKNKVAHNKNISKTNNNTKYSVDSTSTDDAAAKEFGDAAKKGEINLDAFHKAFDIELEKFGALGLFNNKGELLGKHTGGKIKELDSNNHAVRAIKKLGTLSFTEPKYPEVKFDTKGIVPHIYKLERDVPDMAEGTIGYFVANSAEEAVTLANIEDYDYIKDFGEAKDGDKEKIDSFMTTKYDHGYSEKEFFDAIGRKTSYCSYYDYCKVNKIFSLDGLIR